MSPPELIDIAICAAEGHLREFKAARRARAAEFNQLHPDVRTSTGICGSYTFGSGQLDYNGYWENGDYQAARDWERLFPSDYPCWPFSKKELEKLSRGERAI